MKKPKKLLALLLAMIILAGTLPMSALATEEPGGTDPAPVVSVDPDAVPSPSESTEADAVPSPSESADPDAVPSPSESTDPDAVPSPSESADPDAVPSPSESADPDAVPTPAPAATVEELRETLRETLVQMTEEFFSGDFTVESWQEFQAKLAQGWALLTRGYETNANEAPATEAELRSAIATLSLADEALVPLANIALPSLENPVFTQYAANTGSIDENEWFLIVNEHSDAQYAMKYDGSALKIPGTSSSWPELITLSGVDINDYLWHFTKVSGDQYNIQNKNGQYLWNTTTNTAALGGNFSDEVNISTDAKSLGVTLSGYNFFFWKKAEKTGLVGSDYVSLDCDSYSRTIRFGFVQKDGDELVTSRLYKATEADVTYDASPLSVTIKVGENAATAIQNTVVVTKYLNGISSGSIGYTVDASGVNNQEAGVYNATISAEGQNWTVVVTVYDPYAPGPQYPDYPNQGSVYINKTATSNRIAVDGTTWVELSVTGVPKKSPVDVVLVVDASASMKTNSRIDIAKEAATNFANILLRDNDDGTKSENRVAVVTFSMVVNSNGTCDFTSDLNSVTSVISSISANGNDPGVSGKGTNYDVAMEQAYDYLSAAQAEEGYNRQQFVVFLSDGAPENGYNGYSSPTYDRLSSDDKLEHEDSTAIKNLGATIYTVGLEISGRSSDPFSASECREILSQYMANTDPDTGAYLYYDVSAAYQLTGVFNSIANTIRLAGTDAVVTDVVNPAFELEWDPMDGGTKRTIVYARDGVAVETVTLNGAYNATSNLKSGNIADSSGNITARYFTYNAATQTFTWTVGDITQENITLGYYAYLKGSYDDSITLTDDVYETNTEATLSYTNYQDQNCEKIFPVPTVPWTGALAHYEFYLTDANGNPVNQAGQVVPFENRITIYHSYVLIQRQDNVIEATTVYAASDIPAGYALVDEKASYYVNPTAYGENAYQLNGTGTVLVSPEQGADGKVSDDASFIDSTVAFGVTNTMVMTDRTVVVDFGKPITAIELSEATDHILGGKVIGFMTGRPDFDKNTGHVYNNIPEGCAATLNGTYGAFSVADGKAVYTPTSVMNGVETVNVIVESVQREGQGSAGLDVCYMWATLTVIPATNVYYEDTFFTGQNNLVSSGGDVITEQDTYTQGSDTYGYDNHYAKLVIGATDNSTMTVSNKNLPGTFEFTFKGTGVDIYSRTDNSSDMVVAQLYQNGEVKQQQLVYAVYETSGGVLYNVPTISFEGLTYGEYTVKLTIPASGLTGKTFYIDGVRVYDPAASNQDAQNVYAQDGENNSWQVEVRDILLKANDLDGVNGNGAVYVDKTGTTSEITTYKDIGPKNETYLKTGNTIGFKLDKDTYTKVLIGAKSADGSAVTLVVNSQTVKTINTTTDMYYDITEYIGTDGVVTITTTGNGILSLTKLRMTGVTGTPAIMTNTEVLEAAGVTVDYQDEGNFWTNVWTEIKNLFKWSW